ncbi:O-antigen ligase [Fibrobacter sp. UWT3]|nr:O-antigen ligase [Fibrobacter sp. UWT3]
MALALVGVPIGMYLSHFFPVVKWSHLIMLVSFAFSANWGPLKNVFQFRMPFSLIFIFLFELIALVYIIIGDGFGSQQFFYVAFVIVFSVAIGTHRGSVDYGNFPQVLFWTSLPCLIIGFGVSYFNMVVGDEAWYARRENDFYALEPFSVASGALINMFALICIQKKDVVGLTIKFALIAIGLYILLACEKRTPLFIFLIGSLFLFYEKNVSLKRLPRKVVWGSAISIVSFVSLYFFKPSFEEKVNAFCYNMYSGVLNLFGVTTVMDQSGSAIMRAQYREIAWDYIANQMDTIDYFFGAGFNSITQIDNPLIHIFIEMGLFGALAYLYIIVLIPLLAMKSKEKNVALKLCTALTIYSILSIMSSGNPYMYNKYIPICILSIVQYSLRNRTGHEKHFDSNKKLSR